ncbi:MULTISPECIES: hypothetical protein [unclassified Natrinema]|uniref:hypothetical protein n=1 Tax=unclassified Natrinema TaxID=2622230 RepID=UPI0011AE2D1D|nr:MULTISPECIES: hypothetical protein [unclassified Natrinema]
MDESIRQQTHENLLELIEPSDESQPGESKQNETYLFPDSRLPHEFELSELRYMPRFLCDAQILGEGEFFSPTTTCTGAGLTPSCVVRYLVKKRKKISDFPPVKFPYSI